MSKFGFSFLLAFGFFSLVYAAGHGPPPPTDTTCSDGTKSPGTFRFDLVTLSVMQFCDGVDWQSLDAVNYVNDGCSDPGRQRLSSGEMQFCDGGSWHSMDAGVTSTTCAVAGAQIRTRNKVAAYCDGSYWHGMAPTVAPTSFTCNEFMTQRHCLNAAGCSWNAGYCYAPNDCPSRNDATMCVANPQCGWVAGVCGATY